MTAKPNEKVVLCFGDSNTRQQGSALGSEFRIIEEGLNARTTIFEDPLCEHRVGKSYLIPCLSSHRPLDLVIMMLGTNDLKARFGVPPLDISSGLEALIEIIQSSNCGAEESVPKILIISPPPIGSIHAYEAASWAGAQQKCRELSKLCETIASRNNCHLIDSHKILTVNDLSDGIHLAETGHSKLGTSVANTVKGLFSIRN